MTFEQLLHPRITDAASAQWASQHFREAVINAVTAVFDFLRSRTGLDLDGAELVNVSMSEASPHLIFGDLGTESGKNSHRGAMQMLRGLYQGVRNPHAHSLIGAWTAERATRWMIVASAMAYLIEEAEFGSILRTSGIYSEQDESNSRRFLRFFPDGKVLSASIGAPKKLAVDWIPDWLTMDWAEFNHYTPGTYLVDGTKIRIEVPVPDGLINYTGRIVGATLDLRWTSTATKKRGQGTYVFRPARWAAS